MTTTYHVAEVFADLFRRYDCLEDKINLVSVCFRESILVTQMNENHIDGEEKLERILTTCLDDLNELKAQL